ncbi:serine hydrolase domain-containing protein [Pseudoduganella sp. GCM10020061]|uniref:serine hydrolase domain-containing protein n=1 Tax=Pseudoduganella sp. GCM10020061 TaxID=3317345 RepID=UPI0036351977
MLKMGMQARAMLALAACAAMSNAHADALDDAINAEIKRRNVAGVGIAVVKDGKIIREQGYGLANIEHRVPVSARTVFQSGSVGKQFTAALVLLLAQDGKLTLDDPVAKHLANTPDAWKAITIRHLLTHTSGLGDPYDKLDMRKDYTDEELIALEATIPVLFAPGEKFSYSNMGYHLLGFICNKVGGKFYGDQLRERIFEPLGMSTRVINEADIIPHRAAGYEFVDGNLKNQNWVAPKLNTTADGSLYLTARDLAIWDQALHSGKILSKQLQEAVYTPAKLNDGSHTTYGFGWFVTKHNGHKLISHGGAWQGFLSTMNRFVDDKLTVIVLANSTNARPGKLAEIVASHYIPALATVPAKPIADSNPAFTAQLREVIADIAADKLPKGFTDDQVAKLTPAMKYFSKGIRELGALRSVALLSVKDEGESRQYRYRYVFEKDPMIVSARINKAGLIERFGLGLE